MVEVDLVQARAYGEAVFAGMTDFISNADLETKFDLSAIGAGEQALSWWFSLGVIGHLFVLAGAERRHVLRFASSPAIPRPLFVSECGWDASCKVFCPHMNCLREGLTIMFLTGEFAKIARISKRTLQYYDDIGLLRPVHTDPETGYRYYSSKQLPRLNQIIALKELGLTLQQIARMIDGDISDQEIRGMLMLQKADLEKKLIEDLDRFRRIETRLEAGHNKHPDVILKSIPEFKLLSINHFCTDAADTMRFIGALMTQLPAKVDHNRLGHLITLVNADNFSMENIDVEFGFMLEADVPEHVTLDDDLTLSIRTLPAVSVMATTVYIGHLSSSHVAYSALGMWIEDNHYQITGQSREVFIEIPRHGQDIVLELQYPVEKHIHSMMAF
jgi:DNA-binding transcriptional MerR regulator